MGDEAIEKLSLKIDQVLSKLSANEGKLTSIDLRLDDVERPAFETSRTVVMTGIKYNDEAETAENYPPLVGEVEKIVASLDAPDVKIRNVRRFTGRAPDGYERPGVVKVEFSTVGEKRTILREKSKLQESHPNVYMRTSLSHAEMIMIQNNKLLLSLLPDGDKFMVTSNGRIIEKSVETEPEGEDREKDPFASLTPGAAMRGGYRGGRRPGRGGYRGRGWRGRWTTPRTTRTFTRGKGRQMSEELPNADDIKRPRNTATPPKIGENMNEIDSITLEASANAHADESTSTKQEDDQDKE